MAGALTAGVSDEARSPHASSRLAEWARLHRLLDELLDALALFGAGLSAARTSVRPSAQQRRDVFVNWRPCQERVYRLAEFGERVQHIGSPFRIESDQLGGARWAVEIVALQLAIEEALSDQPLYPASLLELADDLQAVCHRHLAIADREIDSLALAQAQRTRELQEFGNG